MTSILRKCFLHTGALLLFCHFLCFGEAVTPNVQPSPPLPPSCNGCNVIPMGIIALPPVPAEQKTFTSPVPLNIEVIKAVYFLKDPDKEFQRISRFVAGVKPYCSKGKSYKEESTSGKLLLSLCVLCQVLEKGPITEHAALGIAKEESSNLLTPDKNLTLSMALATAIADFNTLSKEIYLEDPKLLLNPTPFISFVRNELSYLKSVERKFQPSISQ